MENWKYTAFISYRHGGTDEQVAKTLHTMLESYRLPGKIVKKLGKKKIGRIFRDVDELPSSSSLYNNIEEALKQSEFLIVICTPRLQKSKWCMREIELFKNMRGSEHIIAVLAEGEPQDSFPYEITHRIVDGKEVEIEPLAADVRGEHFREQKKKMKVEQLRILAAMLHCEFDQLRQRDRQRKIQRGIAAGGVSFAVICAFLAQTVSENIRLQKQVRKTQSAQSYLLAEYSDTAFSADNPKLAALLAMEALPENLGDSRPFEGAAMASLTNALQVYDYQKSYTAKENVQTRTMDSLMVSPYDDYIAYIDLTSSTEYTLHFYDIEKGKTVADFPVNPDYNGYRSCNVKMAFFGDHKCAIAGLNGMQVIDMNTLKVLWEGEPGMTVSASSDASVLSLFDADKKNLIFYTADGEKLSEIDWDSENAVYFGMSDDGTYAAITELAEDDEVKAFRIIDTHTGETVKLLDDRQYLNVSFGDGSWCGNTLFFRDKEKKFGTVDMDANGKVHMTDTVIEAEICYVDAEKKCVYYQDGSDLKCISAATGEVLNTYECEKNISDATYTGDGQRDTFAVYCDDGSIEYVDYTEEPFRIGRLEGDGTGCSEIQAGKTYVASCLYNDYEFRIYQLNDRTSSKKGSIKKQPAEQVVTIVRKGETICVNGTKNSYAINMQTMESSEFDGLNSFMQIPNENVLSCDNLDGSISFYDAKTGELLRNLPDTVYGKEEADGAYTIEDGVLKKYDYEKTEKTMEEIEPVYTEEVARDYDNVYISQKGYLVGYKIMDGEDQPDIVEIWNPDRKEIFSQKITDLKGTSERDYIIYQPAGSEDYIVYNYVEDKEITRINLGDLDWEDYIDGGYLFLCSTDQGAYILDDTTGEVILHIAEASTLYTFDAPQGQPYFTALYLSDNGETRLDVYDREELSSPVARIKGGLGMNDSGEVVIYDGVETAYAVPFLSMDEVYEKGQKFLGSQTLTQEQKVQYHCE